jgi:hypothetical protein
MRLSKYSLSAVLALTSVACLQTAAAATITEYDRATFQTALSNTTLSGQNFDTLPVGTITTVNGVTYTPSLGTAVVTNSFLTTTSPNGLGSTSAGFFLSNETLTLTFSSPISAFALDVNTFATAPGAYTATVNDGSNSVITSVFDVFPNTSTGEFFGFTDTSAFTSVTIATNPNDAFSYTVDTLVYGNASALPSTPEPSTLLLLGTGLLGIVGTARRKLFA